MRAQPYASPGHRFGNRLLAALPECDFGSLKPHLHAVPLGFKQVIQRKGDRIRSVYFLDGGSCAVLKHRGNGRLIEIATVGNEGAIGTDAFFEEKEKVAETIMQIAAGSAQVLTVRAFNAAMHQRGALYNLVMRFSQALIAQTAQSAMCIRRHSAEQRGCQWLLMNHDRIEDDTFTLTPDLLSEMVGDTRPAITLVAATLQSAGLVRFSNGRVTILNRKGLEARACGCYAIVNRAYTRLLPEIY